MKLKNKWQNLRQKMCWGPLSASKLDMVTFWRIRCS